MTDASTFEKISKGLRSDQIAKVKKLTANSADELKKGLEMQREAARRGKQITTPRDSNTEPQG